MNPFNKPWVFNSLALFATVLNPVDSAGLLTPQIMQTPAASTSTSPYLLQMGVQATPFSNLPGQPCKSFATTTASCTSGYAPVLILTPFSFFGAAATNTLQGFSLTPCNPPSASGGGYNLQASSAYATISASGMANSVGLTFQWSVYCCANNTCAGVIAAPTLAFGVRPPPPPPPPPVSIGTCVPGTFGYILPMCDGRFYINFAQSGTGAPSQGGACCASSVADASGWYNNLTDRSSIPCMSNFSNMTCS